MSSSADLPAADSGLRLRNAGAGAAGVTPESVPSVEKPSADDRRLNNTNNTDNADTSTSQHGAEPADERDGEASKSNKTYGRTPDGTGNISLAFPLVFTTVSHASGSSLG